MKEYLYHLISCPYWVENLPLNLKEDLYCGKSIVLGNKIYQICSNCRKLICLNKFLLKDLHFCE